MTQRPPLDADRLRTALGGRWARVDVIAETPSTNAALLEDADAPDRSVLVAEHQSAGRGRFQRGWKSPPRAGLTFSALVRPSRLHDEWGWLPLLAGVALADAVRDTTGVPVELKWPNDLLAPDGRKLAGVLAQAYAATAVIGIGLNVSTTAAELPVPTATSLALQGADPDRTEVLAATLHHLADRVDAWERDGPDAVRASYAQLCATLGRPVRVTLFAGASVEGTAADVDPAGRLVVHTDAGVRLVPAGDVEHLAAP